MAQHLRANTEVVCAWGPIVAIADGFTVATTTLATADSAMLIKHGGTAGVTVAARTDAALSTAVPGYRNITLTTTDTNTEGTLTLVVTDVSVCLPIVNKFTVLSEAAYDSLYGADDDGLMRVDVSTIAANAITATAINADAITAAKIADNAFANEHFADACLTAAEASVNVSQISGDSTAADNLEATYDGTGYFNSYAPAYQLQLSGVGQGLAVNAAAESSVVTQGAETNTYANTASHDATLYTVTDSEAGVGIDFYLQFDLGAATAIPVLLHLHGYYAEDNPANQTIAIQAYNHNSAAYETIRTLVDKSAEQEYAVPLNVHHAGIISADEGIVRIRFLHSASEANAAMNINHCTVGYVMSGLQVSDILSSGQALDTTLGVLDTVTNIINLADVAGNTVYVLIDGVWKVVT